MHGRSGQTGEDATEKDGGDSDPGALPGGQGEQAPGSGERSVWTPLPPGHILLGPALPTLPHSPACRFLGLTSCLRMPRPSQEAPPSCRPLGGCLSLGAGPEQGPAIVGDRSCLEAARVDAPKPGLCIRGQQPRGLQPGALRLGWRITARSESDSLPPVLFLGPIGVVRCACRAQTSDPGPAAAATASQNRGLMEFNESPTRQAGLDLRPQPDVWPLAPFPTVKPCLVSQFPAPLPLSASCFSSSNVLASFCAHAPRLGPAPPSPPCGSACPPEGSAHAISSSPFIL